MNRIMLFFRSHIFSCLIIILSLNFNVLHSQTARLNAVSDLKRVFDDGFNLPALEDTLKLYGIRGEVISGQCALQARKNLEGVNVMISELKDGKSGISFPAEDIEWNFIGSIPLTENTPNQPLAAVVRKAPGNFPDYLMAEKQVDIGAKKWQGIWITVNISSAVNPGTYLGSVTVKTSQGDLRLPVELTVFPLILSGDRNLKVTEWYSTDFEQFHGIKERYSAEWFAMLRKYAENMAAHRQNVFHVPMSAILIEKNKEGQLTFDFSRFDQIAGVFWDTGKMDFLETGELARFGENAWFSSEIKLQDFKVKNQATGNTDVIPGKEVIPVFLPAFESHLRELGWLSKSYFHIKDEPSMHNSLAWREMSAYMHHYAPDLIRLDAIETTNLLDEIEVAVPKLDAFGTWYQTYRDAQMKGLELWFYTVGIYQGSLFPNKTIDMPLMNSRIMHWINYKYDATGYLHWGWNQWTDDPYKETGMHIGDGWHVYPSKDGVKNSLRWEEMRNGIQDYECFVMLEKKTEALKDSLGKRADWIEPKHRSKELSGRVIYSIQDHSNDPAVLYQAKKQLLNELIEFNTSPMVYIQTNPSENSTLSQNSSVEVFGWTEPGTEILVNGRKMPVSAQGYFFEQFGGDMIDTTKIPITKGSIRVHASNGKGTKEIVRDFNIK